MVARKGISLTPEVLARIEAYRRSRSPIPSESAAIRDLLMHALDMLKIEQPEQRQQSREGERGPPGRS